MAFFHSDSAFGALGEFYSLSLTGLQGYAFEAALFLFRPGLLGDPVADTELHHLVAGALVGILRLPENGM